MRRRDFVKGILAAGAAAKTISAQQAVPAAQSAQLAQHMLPPQGPVAPGPMPWNRGLLEAPQLDLSALVADSVAGTDAHFFNPAERATLTRLCTLLMPPGKNASGVAFPGALDTGTPEFLDFLIGASPRARQQLYKGGLDWLDAQAMHKFSVSFAKTDDTQADALVRPWLRIWMNEHPRHEQYAAFVNQAHVDIRTATINSREWSDAEEAAEHWRSGYDLYWYPVDPLVHGEPEAVRTPATAAPVRPTAAHA